MNSFNKVQSRIAHTFEGIAMCIWSKLATLVAFLVLAVQAQAAILIVSSDQLTGATDVVVGGTLYDVILGDGSCISLFDGCDDAATDFAFQTESAATAAANALLNQVFIDDTAGSGFNFDALPALTNGCINASSCQAIVPFGVAFGNANTVQAINVAPPGIDNLITTPISRSFDTMTSAGGGDVTTYAIFTATGPVAVPVPATLPLFMVGLIGLGFVHRKRRSA